MLDAPHASAGTLLHGRYRLIERLGAGGFGVVWRAHDEQLHREVALKRIPLPPDPPTPGSPEAEPRAGERASREALATARLAHPAIVALHEAYVDDDAFYLVSELVEGETLAQLIAQDALCDEELLEIGVTLAHALGHAHARGVIHRDVKPQNVLVPYDPGAHETPAKLTDFGGASLTDEQALTRTGETLGTLAYMAPEQSEGLQIGEAADVYSLALVLYEGLTGVNPVRGPTPTATARRIGRPLPPLTARRPDLPRALTDSIDAALAVEPADRATLHELRSALELALTDGPPRRRGLLWRKDQRSEHISHERQHPQQATLTHLLRTDEHRALGIRASAAAGPIERDFEPDPGSTPDVPAHQPHRSRGFPLPRAVWAGCVLALAAWQLVAGRPGLSLLVLAAAAPLLLLGPRPGLGWLIAALAPVLGVLGLASAYPAVAGQSERWSRRAAFGALGYWWLALAEPLLARSGQGSRLWLGAPASTPPRAVWEGSLDSAAIHVLVPTLTIGLACGAALWAAAAAILPLVVRGSSALRDTIAALVWSTALLAVTPYCDAGFSTGAALAQPHGAVLGAIAGAAVVIAGGALRGPVSVRHP